MPWVIGQVLRLLRIDNSVQHERVQRKQRSSLNDVPVGLLIAVGDPSLPPRALAAKVVVLARTPYGIGRPQPEGRWSRASGEIDEDVAVDPS